MKAYGPDGEDFYRYARVIKMSFFGDIYAGEAAAKAAEFNARVEERNAGDKKIRSKKNNDWCE